MKITGIYQIESIIRPDKLYIGSAKDIDHRKRCHLYELRKNKHSNAIIQNHYNKYGEDDLVFTVLDTCDIVDLIKMEQHYIDLMNPSFNIERKAERYPEYVHKMSEEHKEKLRKLYTGKPLSPEHREKLKQAKLGKKQSLEHRAAIGLGNKGKKKPLGFGKMVAERNIRLGIVPPSRKGIHKIKIAS